MRETATTGRAASPKGPIVAVQDRSITELATAGFNCTSELMNHLASILRRLEMVEAQPTLDDAKGPEMSIHQKLVMITVNAETMSNQITRIEQELFG